MNKRIQQTAIFLFLSFASATVFGQSWQASGGNSNLTPTANAGIGIAANSEAKLRMQSATKYGLHLTNTGVSVTPSGAPYSSGTTYGIYSKNTANSYGNTVYGLYLENSASGYGVSINGIYVNNSANPGSGSIYGANLISTTTSSIPVYGVYSSVSSANASNRYAGYFTGGKVVMMNGNVGIGTQTPTTALDVIGVVRAHEVKVCLNQGCDYVFAPDYKLMPIKELSTFVKTNKHLPEVAPAAEMESEGINLSEMNALLLKKVEELTLYIIEQNERIEKLENSVK